ncbi:MAG: hypothetical protein J5637_08830 [Prevotella sp.]|nr:hypothetical protein [Prevotella sp.]
MEPKLIVLFLGVLVLFSACGDDKDDMSGVTDNSRFVICNFTSSGCKNNAGANADGMMKAGKDSPWGEEYIEYQGREGGYLTLKHVNAVFNCAAVDFKTSIGIVDNQIVVNEEDVFDGEMANCVCPYDLTYDAGPLKNGVYTVVLRRYGEEYARTTITFSSSADGRAELTYMQNE